MKRGFTLVELSIVLVIIGLLIGGILVAQSMIETTKVTSSINLLKQYDIATNNFKQKFQFYPGDARAFNAAANQNGQINAGSNDDVLLGEVANFWPSLSQSEALSGQQYPVIPTTDILVGRDVPKLPIGNNTGVVAGYVFDHAAHTFHQQNVYFLANFNMATNSMTTSEIGRSISGVTALAFDTKIDDGLPNSGFVQAPNNSASEFGSQPVHTNCYNNSSFKYRTGETNTCALHVLIDFTHK